MQNFFDLFDVSHTIAKGYLSAYPYPWEALEGLKAYLRGLGNLLNKGDYEEIDREIWVHRSATLSKTACLHAPCIIGAESELRHGALLRGGTLIGKNCVVGNATEVKNSILFDGVKAPHFSYIGDSILGFNAHLGAGCILSNVKADRGLITVRAKGNALYTGLTKLGAMVGDFAELGCNSVVNPGAVIGRNAVVYPLSCVRGEVEENSIYKRGICTPKK